MEGHRLMATNVTIVSGATEIKFYLRNYSYANLVTDLPALAHGLATDLDSLVYKNAAGDTFKILKDASTTSNHPAERILFTDIDGQAESSANLEYDGTDVKIADNNVHQSGNSSIFCTAGGYVWELRAETDGTMKLYRDDIYMGQSWGE
jgi:hypothetical protein